MSARNAGTACAMSDMSTFAKFLSIRTPTKISAGEVAQAGTIAATGARRYSCTQSKTVRSALQISNFIKVEDIFNLPQTIFIDTKNSVTSHISTVSTVSGVHELLRNLFLEIGECFCPFCENKIVNEDSFPESFVVDIVCDTRYNDFLTLLKDYGKVVKELFFDKNQKQLPQKSKAARFAEIHFA